MKAVSLTFSLLHLQDKMNLSCVHSPAVAELMRGIRTQMEGLITGLPPREISAMSLGLAHRYGIVCIPLHAPIWLVGCP